MNMDIDVEQKSLPFSIIPVAALEGHIDRAWSVAWNPVQRLIASCSADKTVRMWYYTESKNNDEGDVDDGGKKSSAPSFTFATEIPTGHRKTVRSIAWAPSGRTLATASFDSTVSIWERSPGDEEEGEELGDWECVSTLEGHDSECKSVAYSSDGSLIASCSRDKSVWIWEVQPDSDFECLSVLMHHTQDVKCVAWHPHEELLASASYDDNILLYVDDPSDDWFPFTTLSGHTSTVWSLAFSPCGSLLASASDDRSIRIWQRFPKPPAVETTPEKGQFGPIVRVGGGGPEAGGRWQLSLVIPDAHERSIYSISWTKSPKQVQTDATANSQPDGASVSSSSEANRGWIASGGGDGRIKIWQINVDGERIVTHQPVAELENTHGVADINCVSWSPHHSGLLASAGDDCTSRIWSVQAKNLAP